MKKFLDGLSSVLGVLATLATIVMMFTITADVVYRTTANKSVPGLMELSETVLVAAVFLGMAYTGATNGHIAVDLLTERLPKSISRWLIAVGWILTTVIVAWMLYATLMRAIESTDKGEIRMGLVNWPLYPARWLIVVGLAAMLLVAVVNVVRTVGGKEVLGFKELSTVATDTRTFEVAADERADLSVIGSINEPVVTDHRREDDK